MSQDIDVVRLSEERLDVNCDDGMDIFPGAVGTSGGEESLLSLHPAGTLNVKFGFVATQAARSSCSEADSEGGSGESASSPRDLRGGKAMGG